MLRRSLLRAAFVPLGYASLGPTKHVLAMPGADITTYGPLNPADSNGIRLPRGFKSRIIVRSRGRVEKGGQPWHDAPASAACIPDGAAWMYVSNSATLFDGRVAAIRFNREGGVRSIVHMTARLGMNRAGAVTSAGSWLTYAETSATGMFTGPSSGYGRLLDIDPSGRRAPLEITALAGLKVAAFAFALEEGSLYALEDTDSGRVYRFRPGRKGRLTSGLLQVMAAVDQMGAVRWLPCEVGRETSGLSFPSMRSCLFIHDRLWFTAAGGDQLWSYDPSQGRIKRIAEGLGTSPTAGMGTLAGNARGLFVVTNNGAPAIARVTKDQQLEPVVRTSLRTSSGLSGLAFSPDGTRLYFSTPYGPGESALDGITYEIAGPFV